MKLAINCCNVVAGYRDTTVLNGMTLTLAAGQSAALLGPNGAGKSTLLRVLTGLQPYRAGTVELFGRPVDELSPYERARLVAVVPQEVSTPMAFTVEEIITLGRTIARRRWSRLTTSDRQAVELALALTDLLELRNRLFTELSGGEKQRAVIAMALAQEPRLLLLDEPTSHLDINHRLEVLQLLERLNREQGVAVLMTSHDLTLAAEYFSHLFLIDHGRIVAAGPPSAVLREDLLADVYHCRLAVRRDEAGAVVVAPQRTSLASADGKRRRAHVVGGGGSAVEVLRRLCLSGWNVTAGALNEGDSDAVAGAALGLKMVLEKPFSPISPAVLQQASSLASAAEVVIVCEVPFGPGNVANLELAREALRAGKGVFVNVRHAGSRDHTTDGRAGQLLAELLAAGAKPWQQIGDLLAELD